MSAIALHAQPDPLSQNGHDFIGPIGGDGLVLLVISPVISAVKLFLTVGVWALMTELD